MATRSKVGFKNSDGTVNASYVHFDGYLDGVGVALHLNHNSDSKAKKLGYAKGIRSIELDSPVSYYNDMENETYESEDAFHDEVVKDFEYGYLYDPSRGWLFTSSKYGTNDFIELEDQLMYDELLPGSGDAPDMSMMENVSISKLKEVEVGVVDKTQDEEEMGLEEGGFDLTKTGASKASSSGGYNTAKSYAKMTAKQFKEDIENEGQDAVNMANADIEEGFDDLVKKVDKAKGYTKKEAEKVAGAIAAKKMKGAGKGPTAKQKARVKEDKEIYDTMRDLTLKEYFKRFTK